LIQNTSAEINHVGVAVQTRPSASVTNSIQSERLAGEDARQPTITSEDIRACSRRLIALSPEAEAERRQTKDFLHQQVYFSPALDPEKEAAERIITDLFELWMKHPEKLPESYREKSESEPLPRVICDYIAGMTDTYIYEQYEKFCGA
jgi:dGTPase